MIHIMLDLETRGRRPGCDVRSIGACVFEPETGFVTFPLGAWQPGTPNSELFYAATDGSKYSLNRDPETEKWWSEQSVEAQSAFENPIDLQTALIDFDKWLRSLTHDRYIEELRIWANDPHFDVSILEAAYHAVGLTVPWHYRSPRSFRTVVELAGITRNEMINFSYGDAHNALHDAISQSMIVCHAYRKLGLSK